MVNVSPAVGRCWWSPSKPDSAASLQGLACRSVGRRAEKEVNARAKPVLHYLHTLSRFVFIATLWHRYVSAPFFFFFFAAPRDMQDPNSPTRNWTCAPCSAVRSPNRRTTGEVPLRHALNNETGFRKMEQSTQVPQVELIHFDDFKAHTLVLTALDLAHSRRPSKKMTHIYPLPPGKKSSHVLLYKYYSEQDHQNTHLFLSKDHFQASSSCLF